MTNNKFTILFDEFGTPTFVEDSEANIFAGLAVLYSDSVENDILDNLSIFIVVLSSTLILSGSVGLIFGSPTEKQGRNFVFDYLIQLLLFCILFAVHWNLGVNGRILIIGFLLLGFVLNRQFWKRRTAHPLGDTAL